MMEVKKLYHIASQMFGLHPAVKENTQCNLEVDIAMYKDILS